ncbi:hypothetical protein [Actinophytocola sediminis]
MTDTPTLLLVHGARRGPWAWHRLQRLLADVNIVTHLLRHEPRTATDRRTDTTRPEGVRSL